MFLNGSMRFTAIAIATKIYPVNAKRRFSWGTVDADDYAGAQASVRRMGLDPGCGSPGRRAGLVMSHQLRCEVTPRSSLMERSESQSGKKDTRMHPVTLRFPHDLEREFQV